MFSTHNNNNNQTNAEHTKSFIKSAKSNDQVMIPAVVYTKCDTLQSRDRVKKENMKTKKTSDDTWVHWMHECYSFHLPCLPSSPVIIIQQVKSTSQHIIDITVWVLVLHLKIVRYDVRIPHSIASPLIYLNLWLCHSCASMHV